MSRNCRNCNLIRGKTICPLDLSAVGTDFEPSSKYCKNDGYKHWQEIRQVKEKPPETFEEWKRRKCVEWCSGCDFCRNYKIKCPTIKRLMRYLDEAYKIGRSE